MKNILNKVFYAYCIARLFTPDYSIGESEKQKKEWGWGFSPCYHTVRENETLKQISENYLIPLEELERINKLNNTLTKENKYYLKEGEKIKLLENCE